MASASSSPSSTSASGAVAANPLGRALRGTFKAMSDWGDDFERRHFDGDFIGAVARAPTSAFKAMGELGHDGEHHINGEWAGAPVRGGTMAAAVGTGSARRWRYAPADGWPIDVRSGPDVNATRTSHQLQAGETFYVAEERPAADGVLLLRLADGTGWLFDRKPGIGVLCVREAEGATSSSSPRQARSAEDEAAAVTALWEQSQSLQKELDSERDRRRGRAIAQRALDEALKPLRSELAEEQLLRAAHDSGRSAADLRAQAMERAYMELQERHHALLSKKASNEAEMQRHFLEERAVAAAERAACAGVPPEQLKREWARDGPETEALKMAKVELAEVLGLVDAARLERRRELASLQAQVEEAEAESLRLRRRGDCYVAPKGSFLTSVRRLLTVAVGRDDPYAHLEDAAT